MIIQKTVEVTVNNNKLTFYRENGFPDCKRYDKINIPVEWLGSTSKIKIECECDYCHKHFLKAYGKILLGREQIEKDCCDDCKYQKIEEVNLKKYGVKTNLMLEENRKKSKQTLMNLYGVENPMQSEELKEKQKKSLIEHYGVDHPMKSPEIKNKARNTIIERYGYEFSKNGLLLINGIYCSKAQKYICDRFDYKINELVEGYYVDGIKDFKIIEYNGGGHRRDVIQNKISDEAFNEKEQKRYEKLLSKGYGLLVINNSLDKVINEIDYQYIHDILHDLQPKQIVYYQIEGSTTIENISE